MDLVDFGVFYYISQALLLVASIRIKLMTWAIWGAFSGCAERLAEMLPNWFDNSNMGHFQIYTITLKSTCSNSFFKSARLLGFVKK
jgi:hypothetical protein